MRLFSVIFLVVCVSFTSVAQIENASTMDRKYTPPAGSIFHTESKANSGSVSSVLTDWDHKNIFKSELSLLSRGVIAFNYERKLFNPISAELGFGVTAFPDYILFIRAAISDEMYNMATPAVNGPGYFYKIGFRYNYNEMGDGGFMGVYYRNITHNLYDKDRTYDQYFQVSRDLYYDYGAQFPLGDKANGELSIGLGYRFLTFYESRFTGSQYTLLDDFDIHFFMNIGVKIGFGF